MRAILENPHSFSFYQIVSLLQRYAGGARIGHQGPASEETLRLRPTLSLSFPAADVHAVELCGNTASGAARYRVTSNFMGLCSSDSPLPTFYTENLLWSETDQPTVRHFLDLFHHRALSLLYRAWEKYRYPVQFRHRGADEISHRVYSLIGLGTPPLRDGTGVSQVRLLRYAGLMSTEPRSASALSAMLSDYFDLPGLGVEQCVERRVQIEPSQQNRLGGRNCSLGRDFVPGAAVRDRMGKFRVSSGPLPLARYLQFLPSSESYAALVNLTRLFVADRLEFDLRLTLRADEVPGLALSSAKPQRLGWTTWLPPVRRDPSVVLGVPKSQSPQAVFQQRPAAGRVPPTAAVSVQEAHDRR